MIQTTAQYKQNIKADARQILPKVEVFFNGENQLPTIFTGDEIVNIALLEESKAEGENPLGFVSANEVTITFDNSKRDFTPTNQNGAYYGKLKPNTVIKPYLGLAIGGGVEYIPLGKFKTGDWHTPSQSLEATVTAYDRLYEIADIEAPQLPVVIDTTIAAMFQRLFIAIGLQLSEFTIDSSLTQPIRAGWFERGKIIKSLQTLAIAGNCHVTTDRYGRIKVQSNIKTGSTIATYTDQDMIYTTQNPQKILDTYSKVRVGYRLPYIKQPNALIEIENFNVPSTGVLIENIEYEDSPVVQINQIELLGAVNSEVESYSFGATGITIKISNTGPAESVTLRVIGRAVGSHTSSREAINQTLAAEYGIRELTVFNHLIQTLEVAENYATNLLQYVSDPLVNFEVDFRGDPSLEVYDAIKIINNADKIGTVNIVPYRIMLDYDGTLHGTMQGRRL